MLSMWSSLSLSPSAGPAASMALGNQVPCLLVKNGYLSSSLRICIPGVGKEGSRGEWGPCSLRRCTRISKQCFWSRLLRNAELRPCLAGGMAGKHGLWFHGAHWPWVLFLNKKSFGVWGDVLPQVHRLISFSSTWRRQVPDRWAGCMLARPRDETAPKWEEGPEQGWSGRRREELGEQKHVHIVIVNHMKCEWFQKVWSTQMETGRETEVG